MVTGFYRLGVAAVASLLWAGAAAAITIDTVPVGNLHNGADPLTGFGQVSYAYNIGKYEVTAGQYAAFLNAVGGVDTYGLYVPGMDMVSYGGGITRIGGGTQENLFHYTVNADCVNRPVAYVSYWNACRFTNWLQNGQPTGAEGPGTTETGAYTLTADGMITGAIARNAGTAWAITSADEWYKAAYYEPTLGNGAGGYWLYPTRSNTVPGQDMADLVGDNANYDYVAPWLPIDSGKYTTLVGQFQNSASAYGTFDQAGNVWEWTDEVRGSSRDFRGGSWTGCETYIRSTNCGSGGASTAYGDIGFRVVQLTVPEPASIGVLGWAAVASLVRRRNIVR